MTPPLLTIAETARALDVSTRTVFRYLQGGKLTPVRRKEGGPVRVYVRHAEVERFKKRRFTERHGAKKTKSRRL